MWSGTLTPGVDSVTVMQGSLHGRGSEFALVGWLLQSVTDHRVRRVMLSHLPKGRFSYPRRAFNLFRRVRGAGAGLAAAAGPAAGRTCSTGIRLAPRITETLVGNDEQGRTLAYEAAG